MMKYYLKITSHEKQLKGPSEFSLENTMPRAMTMAFYSVKSNIEERMSLSPSCCKGCSSKQYEEDISKQILAKG